MSIPTPAELAEHVTAEQEAVLNSLIAAAKDELERRWCPGNSVWLSVPKGYAGRVHERFTALMAAKGWRVTYHSDQRDGDALEIKAAAE